MDGWLGINNILGTELAAISCLRKFKVYYDTTRWKTNMDSQIGDQWPISKVDHGAAWHTCHHPNKPHSFFHNISKLDSCLHHLLQPPRDTSVTSRLHSSTPLPRPISRTKKFESFPNFALNNFTNHLCNSVTKVFF